MANVVFQCYHFSKQFLSNLSKIKYLAFFITFCFVVSLAKMVTLTTNIVYKKSSQYSKYVWIAEEKLNLRPRFGILLQRILRWKTWLRVPRHLKLGENRRSDQSYQQVSSKIQQTKMHVMWQKFGDLFLFGLVWQYPSVQTKYSKGTFKVMATYLQHWYNFELHTLRCQLNK